MLSKWFRTSALWAFRVQLGLNGLGSEGGCPQGPEGPGQDEVHELGTQFGLELWSSEQEAAGGGGWGCLGFCFPADREIVLFPLPCRLEYTARMQGVMESPAEPSKTQT